MRGGGSCSSEQVFGMWYDSDYLENTAECKVAGKLGSHDAAEPKLKEKVLLNKLERLKCVLVGIDNKVHCIPFGCRNQGLIRNNVSQWQGSNGMTEEQDM